MHDEHELAATELQIREFGQTPRQLFLLPHPSRLCSRGEQLVGEEVRTVGRTTEGLSRIDSNSGSSWEVRNDLLATPTSREEEWEHVVCPGGEEEEESGHSPGEYSSWSQPVVEIGV